MGQKSLPSIFTRRAALLRAAQGCMLLSAWQGPAAQAALVKKTDPRIIVDSIQIEPGQAFTGYLARPKQGSNHPGVIIIHDVQGITPYIKDVTRRLAVEGFIALSPDFRMAANHGTIQDPIRRLLMMNDIEASKAVAAAAAVLGGHTDCSGKIGVLGFGWGGTVANYLPLNNNTLDAAIGYYGLQPLYFQDDSYRSIKTAVQMHFAGRDTLTNEGIAIYETNLSDAGKYFETYMYAGVGRGFDDDTNVVTYDKSASSLAWQRSILFFNNHLR